MEENSLSLTCPEWTAADYQSTAPFEWLYEQRANKFLMLQLIGIIAQKAGAVGVKNFRTLWKAYLEMRCAKEGIQLVNATNFSDVPKDIPELSCGEYTASDEGITLLDRWGGETLVCAHPIMPIRRLTNIDSGEVKTEIAFRRGKTWRRIIFDKSVLASGQKIIEMAKYGVAVDSENARDLVSYLSAIECINYDRLPEANSVGRLGWIDGYGFSPYVDNLIFDGELQYRDMFAAVKSHGDYGAWLDVAKEARRGCVPSRVILAASFASVLVEPCGTLPFFVHMWGGSEAGKTVGLMLAASVWASPEMGKYIHTFNSTSVSQELTAGFCNSLPLCIDELQIIRDHGDNDGTIYRLCEGIGRGRGAKTGGLQKMQTWRNCILTTGEMPIVGETSGGGAVNRVLEIDCKEDKLFADGHATVEVLRKNYGFAGQLFIDALSDPETMETARKIQAAFYDQLCKGEATEKQAMAASMILTGDAMAALLIFEDEGSLTVDDLKPYLVSKRAMNQNERAYDWLIDFVASNPQRFGQNQNKEYSGECWGEIDTENNQIYIIKSVFDLKMKEAGYSGDSFLSWAKQNKKVETAKGRTTKTHRMAGQKTVPRCVCLEMKEISDDGQETLPF